MTRTRRLLLRTFALAAVAATAARAQSSTAPSPRGPGAVSFGAAAGPAGSGALHVMGTVLFVPLRSFVAFRLDAAVVLNRPASGGAGSVSGSVLVPLLRAAPGRALAPYALAGVGAAVGGVGHPLLASAGVGARYAAGPRAYFVEARALGAAPLLSLGVQF